MKPCNIQLTARNALNPFSPTAPKKTNDFKNIFEGIGSVLINHSPSYHFNKNAFLIRFH